MKTAFEVQFPAPPPFKERLNKAMRVPLVLTAIFAFVALGFRGLMKDHKEVQELVPLFDLIAFIAAVIIQYRAAQREETWFITSLSISPENIEINYIQKDETKTASGRPEEFIFQKKTAFGRIGASTQTSYINIFYHEKFVLRQYTGYGWTDMKFIEVMHAMKNV